MLYHDAVRCFVPLRCVILQLHSPTKPVLVFVSSRRQTRLTALDLITYAVADERPHQFLRIAQDDMDALLPRVKVGQAQRQRQAQAQRGGGGGGGHTCPAGLGCKGGGKGPGKLREAARSGAGLLV